MLKTLNLNELKSNKIEDDVTQHDVVDDINDEESYYDRVDDKMRILNEFLESVLTEDEIILFKFYKLNTLRITAVFFDKEEDKIKYEMRKIRAKINEAGGFQNIKLA